MDPSSFDQEIESNQLWLAARMGDADLVARLLDDDDSDQQLLRSCWYHLSDTTPLQIASLSGQVDVVAELLNHGAMIDHQDQLGRTALWLASSRGHSATINLLLEYGANPNQTDHDWRTPLWIASANGYWGLVELLLYYGADPLIADKLGRSPLWIASANGHLDVVDLLTIHGAGFYPDVSKRRPVDLLLGGG